MATAAGQPVQLGCLAPSRSVLWCRAPRVHGLQTWRQGQGQRLSLRQVQRPHASGASCPPAAMQAAQHHLALRPRRRAPRCSGVS